MVNHYSNTRRFNHCEDDVTSVAQRKFGLVSCFSRFETDLLEGQAVVLEMQPRHTLYLFAPATCPLELYGT